VSIPAPLLAAESKLQTMQIKSKLLIHYSTTGNSRFAMCHRHSAKPKKHSANDLLSVTLAKQHTTSTVPANVSLPSVFYRALGKDFAES